MNKVDDLRDISVSSSDGIIIVTFLSVRLCMPTFWFTGGGIEVLDLLHSLQDRRRSSSQDDDFKTFFNQERRKHRESVTHSELVIKKG